MKRRHCTFTLTGVMVVVCFSYFFVKKFRLCLCLIFFFEREKQIESSQNISDIEWFSPCLSAYTAADDWTLQQVSSSRSGLFVWIQKKNICRRLLAAATVSHSFNCYSCERMNFMSRIIALSTRHDLKFTPFALHSTAKVNVKITNFFHSLWLVAGVIRRATSSLWGVRK